MKRWIPITVAGDHPHPCGLIQRVDDKAISAILAQPIPPDGIQLDFDHYSGLTNAERQTLATMGIQLPSKAAGWIKKFTGRMVDGVQKIFGLAELTPEGEAAIANKSYVRTSPVYPRSALEHLGDGIVRTLAISSVALTNEPNIRAIGPILANRAAACLANSGETDMGDLTGATLAIERLAPIELENRNGENMEAIAKALNCEPTEEAILAAIAALKKSEPSEEEMANRAKAESDAESARKAELDGLKNRAEKAESELEAIRRKVEEDGINARVAAELAKYPDLPNRAAAEDILRADFAKGSAFLASMPVPEKVPGKNPGEEDLNNREDGNDQPCGVDRIRKHITKK